MLTPEEREARRSVLGASDVACVLGLSPYRGPWSVWRSKREDDGDTDYDAVQTIGSVAEGALRNIYGARHGATVEGSPMLTRDGWMGCSPDGIVTSEDGSRWGLELKVIESYDRANWGMAGTDRIRRDYLVQCAWSRMVSGFSRWDLMVAFIPRRVQVWLGGVAGSDPDRARALFSELADAGVIEVAEYTTGASERLEARLLERCEAWWVRHVVIGGPPPIDDSEACAAAVKALEAADGSTMEARGVTLCAVRALARTKAEAKALADRERLLKSIIQRRMGGAERLTARGVGHISWKQHGQFRPYLEVSDE